MLKNKKVAFGGFLSWRLGFFGLVYSIIKGEHLIL